jgi:uncharacterized protein (TIGR02118 family)
MHASHDPGPIVAASRDISRRSLVVGAGFAGIAAALAAAGWTVETYAQDATPISTPQPMAELNALVVLYGQPTDPAAFEEYYVTTHLPLANGIELLQQLILVSNLVLPEGGQGDHYRMTLGVAASQDDLMTVLASEQGQAAVADIANFATGGFTAYLGHVESMARTEGESTPAASPGA